MASERRLRTTTRLQRREWASLICSMQHKVNGLQNANLKHKKGEINESWHQIKRSIGYGSITIISLNRGNSVVRRGNLPGRDRNSIGNMRSLPQSDPPGIRLRFRERYPLQTDNDSNKGKRETDHTCQSLGHRNGPCFCRG